MADPLEVTQRLQARLDNPLELANVQIHAGQVGPDALQLETVAGALIVIERRGPVALGRVGVADHDRRDSQPFMGLGRQIRGIQRRGLLQRPGEFAARPVVLPLIDGQHAFQDRHAHARPADFGAGGVHLAQVAVKQAAAGIGIGRRLGLAAQRGDHLAVVVERGVIAAENEVGLGRLAIRLGGVLVVQVPFEPGHADRHALGVAFQQVELILDEAQLLGLGRGQPAGRDLAKDGQRRAAQAAPNLHIAVGKPDVDRGQRIARLPVVVGGGGVFAAQSAQFGGLGVGRLALFGRHGFVDQPAKERQHGHFASGSLHDAPLEQLLIGRRVGHGVDRRRPAQDGQRHQQFPFSRLQPPPQPIEQRPDVGPRVQPAQLGQVVAAAQQGDDQLHQARQPAGDLLHALHRGLTRGHAAAAQQRRRLLRRQRL